MKQFEGAADFEVTWLPFQLNPAASKEGVDKMTMYKQKFGEDRMNQMIPRMKQTGLEDGINFSYGGKTGNTFDSHRLISWAQKQGKQDALVEELFKNYFEQEKFIGDEKVLIAAGEKAGLQNVQDFLRGDGEAKEVMSDLRRYQDEMQINGVPHFIVGGKYQVGGAQEAPAFTQLFQKILGSR